MPITLNGTTGITDVDGGTMLPTADIATQAQAEAGTDNTKLMTPLSVAQAIASLTPTPAGSHTLLGTITTTSGTTQTLSGLTLTDYKFLLLMVNGVSNGSGGTFYLTSVLAARTFAIPASGGVEVSGNILIDLSTGVFSSSCGVTSGTPSNYGGLSGISSASTSVSVLSSNAFDLGSIKVYGVK